MEPGGSWDGSINIALSWLRQGALLGAVMDLGLAAGGANAHSWCLWEEQADPTQEGSAPAVLSQGSLRHPWSRTGPLLCWSWSASYPIPIPVLTCILLVGALSLSPHWPGPNPFSLPKSTCTCRRKSQGKLDLLSQKDSYHPMAEYLQYQSHGRYAPPNSKPNPYSQVRARRAGTFTYTNPAAGSDNL
uniref:Uncharacterized protein n=1 Tax=Corvus moneduloides TaxID=1196302 RepID=A0A8U7NZG9_CORMO